MMGRKRNAINMKDAGKAVNSTLDDMKSAATANAIKAATGTALNALGTKVANTVQDAGKQAGATGKNMHLDDQAASAGHMLQLLGKRAGDAMQQAGKNDVKLSLNLDDLPRLMRGLTLLARGAGTIFAPGSSLDASSSDPNNHMISEQARHGIDMASAQTRRQIKEIIDEVKNALSSLSEVLTEGIEVAETKAQRALDQTEMRLTKATEQAARATKSTLPKPDKGHGVKRWLLWGVMLGGGAAYLTSPFGEQVRTRLMGGGRGNQGNQGSQSDQARQWPSSTTAASNTMPANGTSAMAQGQAGQAADSSSDSGKTETWKQSEGTEESIKKA